MLSLEASGIFVQQGYFKNPFAQDSSAATDVQCCNSSLPLVKIVETQAIAVLLSKSGRDAGTKLSSSGKKYLSGRSKWSFSLDSGSHQCSGKYANGSLAMPPGTAEQPLNAAR